MGQRGPRRRAAKLSGFFSSLLAVKAFPAQPGTVPGTKWEYSNAGYMLLGCIVARTSGMSFRAFVQQRIFDRLGMRDSLFEAQQPIPHDDYSGSAVVPWLASGYNGTPPRIETALSKMYIEDAAGGIITTAADLRRFDDGYFRSRWLRPEVRAQMYGQPFRVSARGGYGFGWIVPSEAGPRLIHSSGGTNGFVSDYAHYLDDGLGIIVLSNCGTVDVETLRGRIASLVLARPRPAATPARLSTRTQTSRTPPRR
jgi:CubicO group peptidase (beta-lactamase class C family)